MGVALACKVGPEAPALRDLVSGIAAAAGCPERPLHLQALLQLPQVADGYGDVAMSVVEELMTELARELPPAPLWAVACQAGSPRSLQFGEISASEARSVTDDFHYLRSTRDDGRAYGSVTPGGGLVAMCVTSPLDVPHLEAMLAGVSGPRRSPRVLSRVFAFEGAPRNTISHLLSQVCQAERRLGVTDMLTYVNPNMGFTGSSYRASGWCLLGTEPGTSYRYLDHRYVTDRRLVAAYGTSDDTSLRQLAGGRFAVSTMRLMPLLVFHRTLL